MVKMKDSGLEWIGKIPEDWKSVKFNAIYNLRTEKVSDKDFPPLSVTKKGIVPQLDTAAKTNNGDNRKLVKKGDFAINSRSDRRGSCGISKYDGSVSLINTVLFPRNSKMDPRYYDWLFHTTQFADEFYKWGHGIVDDLWTTNWQDMKNITLILPPLLQQQTIADFLDKKCADIDKLSAQIQKEIDTLQKYRKSVITKTVTKGLDDTVPMKESGIEWIGKIPETWKLEKIKFLTSKIQKGLSPQYQDKGKTNIITQATFSKGYWDESSLKKAITSHRDEKLNLVKKHDILLATTGGGVLGKTYFIKKDINYVASADVVFIRGNDKRIINKLIYYCLFINYNLLNGIMAQGSTNQLHLNVNNLKNFKLPVGSIDVQQRIVNYLDNKTSQIDKIISQKQKQLSLLSDYKNSLIFEYVTGKKQISSNGGEK